MSDTLENHHNLVLCILNACQSAEFLKADHCCAFYVFLIPQLGRVESRVCFSSLE